MADALADCAEAAAVLPQSATLRANHGTALLAAGRPTAALAAFDAALALDGGAGGLGANSLANRAHALLELRDGGERAAEAAVSAAAALALEPGPAAAAQHRQRALAAVEEASVRAALPIEALMPLK
jgi:Tfp pilus assembly protein PilF